MMGNQFRYGFKAEAESLSLEIRAELSLGAHDRLDPRVLAEHLAIAVVDLSALLAHGASATSVRHFEGGGRSDFSAGTVFRGDRRIIVVNDSHALVRQASSLAHELSHVLLEHEPHRALSDNGCRRWTVQLENEADWMAGALLVPRDGALQVARDDVPLAQAAAHFGVSEQMMRWRLANTGALRQAQRERARRPSRARSIRSRGQA